MNLSVDPETAAEMHYFAFFCLLALLEVWHWICEGSCGEFVNTIFLCIPLFEPTVVSLHFVSHSALLSEFVVFSVSDSLLCHAASGSEFMGDIVLFARLYAFLWMSASELYIQYHILCKCKTLYLFVGNSDNGTI